MFPFVQTNETVSFTSLHSFVNYCKELCYSNHIWDTISFGINILVGSPQFKTLPKLQMVPKYGTWNVVTQDTELYITCLCLCLRNLFVLYSICRSFKMHYPVSRERKMFQFMSGCSLVFYCYSSLVWSAYIFWMQHASIRFVFVFCFFFDPQMLL